jgi:hypothetical protein
LPSRVEADDELKLVKIQAELARLAALHGSRALRLLGRDRNGPPIWPSARAALRPISVWSRKRPMCIGLRLSRLGCGKDPAKDVARNAEEGRRGATSRGLANDHQHAWAWNDGVDRIGSDECQPEFQVHDTLANAEKLNMTSACFRPQAGVSQSSKTERSNGRSDLAQASRIAWTSATTPKIAASR